MLKSKGLIERFEQISSDVQTQHKAVMKDHRMEMRKSAQRFLYVFALSMTILWGGLHIHLITGNTFSRMQINTMFLSAFAITGFALLLIISRLLRRRLIKNTIKSIELFYDIGQLTGTLKEDQ